MNKALRAAALLPIALSGAAAVSVALAGCGSGGVTRPAVAALEREDLTAVSRGLRQAASSVAREVAAAKLAWPLVANGLPAAGIPATTRARVAAAGAAARALVLPPPMSEAQARELTGPAAGIAGLYMTFSKLAARGWALIGAAIDELDSGPPAAARFARANVALYIDSVYDGHFDAALIGKSLLAGYRKLGGARAFGAALTQAEVDALARAYAPAAERLHPHAGVKLGS